MPSSGALRQALLVALARVATTAACWWSGFRAISDDDYSRVVIAARFAQHPAADPSGTSWLPLPFWLYGVPMALFGDSLVTARGVALVLGALSAVLVWLTGRLLGLSERAALWGALGAVVLPYGAWLSSATVPEAPTAALLLFGVVSLVRPETKLRGWGGLALGAACFSRYEAWAPAVVFSALTAFEAARTKRRALWLASAMASLPIGLWLLHGAARHGDAWFFVARVNQYREALGGVSGGLVHALLATPWAVVRFEPELFAIATVALTLSMRKDAPFSRAAWRPIAALAALVLFLIAADVSGGAATHHPERSLLPVFWFLALLTAGLVVRLAEQPRAWLLPALAIPLAVLASVYLRPELVRSFGDRHEEEQIGSVLRRLGATDVALDTNDYGFFAVQAALGHGRSWAMSSHDPRLPSPAAPTSTAELDRRLRGRHARWLVIPAERAALAAPLGEVRLSTARFRLLELNP